MRFPLAAPDGGGEAEVVAICQYCSQPVVVQIPSKYVPEDHLFRGLKSVPKAT